MTEVLATYVLQLIGEREAFPFNEPRLPESILREVEENINDLINYHYRVQIKEWDKAQNGESYA